MLESIWVEEVVGVVWFVWWVMRRGSGRGGGRGFGGSLHWGGCWRGGQDECRLYMHDRVNRFVDLRQI